MEPAVREISWEAPEHHYTEKSGDWFIVLAIIVTALAVAAILFGNTLFALLIAVAGGVMALFAHKPPTIINYAVNVRGLVIGDNMYPFSTLQSYHIDEDHHLGPHLLVMSSRKLMPLLSMPLPVEYIDDVEEILQVKLPEEFLEEPLLMKVLEIFGF